jgi:hypothetical protein
MAGCHDLVAAPKLIALVDPSHGTQDDTRLGTPTIPSVLERRSR